MPKTSEATEVRTYGFEVRKVANRTVTGKVASYGIDYPLGSFVEQLRPGVFKKSIAQQRSLPLMAHHAHDTIPVGRSISWEDTDEHLIGTWELDSREEAQEYARLVESEMLTGLSVSFAPLNSRWSDGGDAPHVERIECRLLEVSLVAIPAYQDAGIVAIRSAGHPEIPGLEIAPTPRLDEARRWLESLRQNR